jgi:DNA-binding LacI/PurR family transcriptional regulator
MGRKRKFEEIANRIVSFIEKEKLCPGDRLPSEKKLAMNFGVNHLTVRKALSLLCEKGITHKKPSRGNFAGAGREPVSKSGLIGVLFPEEEPYFYDIFSALENRMSLFGYTPLFHITRGSTARERGILESFERNGAEGIISAPNVFCGDAYEKLKVPAVFFDNYINESRIPYIVTDDLKGAADAVSHLISLGHRRIAYIGGKNDFTAVKRFEGYCSVLKEAGQELSENYIFRKEYSRRWGYNAASFLFDERKPPTAIFCGNDTIAAGVLGYMSNRGLRCPENLSVAGFGDLNFSEGLGLTTVNQSCRAVAESVWSVLSSLIEGEKISGGQVLPTSLIVRHSTAPPVVA